MLVQKSQKDFKLCHRTFYVAKKCVSVLQNTCFNSLCKITESTSLMDMLRHGRIIIHYLCQSAFSSWVTTHTMADICQAITSIRRPQFCNKPLCTITFRKLANNKHIKIDASYNKHLTLQTKAKGHAQKVSEIVLWETNKSYCSFGCSFCNCKDTVQIILYVGKVGVK